MNKLADAQAKKRLLVADARALYFVGEFAECIEACKSVVSKTDDDRSELALLSARSLVRLHRYDEVEKSLEASRSYHRSVDASVTALMLKGMMYVRRGEPDEGIKVLARAAARGRAAHKTIRSEIAFCQAMGYWMKRDIQSAQRYLSRVSSEADIIHARSLELRAYCSLSVGKKRDAANLFVATLLRLDECRAQDKAIEASAIVGLCNLTCELNDANLASFVEKRSAAMRWTSGLCYQEYSTAYILANYNDFAGHYQKAMDYALAALELSRVLTRPVAGTIGAYVTLWRIARHAGDYLASRSFLRRALSISKSLDFTSIAQEDRFLILDLAEATVDVDVRTARTLFVRYKGLVVDMSLALSGSGQLAGQESYVDGLIAQAEGDRQAAHQRYVEARDRFEAAESTCGFITATYALFRITGDESLRWHIVGALQGVTNWITQGLDEASAPCRPSVILSTLSEIQRDVLRLVCLGKSNRDIAKDRGVAEQSIRNLLSEKLFKAFGVTSRAQLIALCIRSDVAAGGPMLLREGTAVPLPPAEVKVRHSYRDQEPKCSRNRGSQ